MNSKNPSNSINIRIVTDNDQPGWDGYVLSNPDAGPYHLYGWKTVVENVYGHKGYYLIAENGHDIKGVLPLLYVRVPFLGGNLVSLPFCDIGGVLAEDEFVRYKLLDDAFSLSKELQAKFLEIRCYRKKLFSDDGDLPTEIEANKVSMLLDIPGSSQELWNGFKSKLRSQVRKAEKNGLHFSWGDASSLDDFYKVFSRNMHDLGSPVHSKKWLENVIVNFAENARVGIVRLDEKTVGVGLILLNRHNVSIPWASTLREYNRLNPNMLLYWNFLKFSADNGFRQFDFGRSTPDQGTFRFKKQWGATPSPLYWHKVYVSGRRKKAGSKRSSSRQTLAGLWAKMPLFLANFLGPKFRKYISL